MLFKAQPGFFSRKGHRCPARGDAAVQLVQTPASLHYGVPARATDARSPYQPGVPEGHAAEVDRHVSNQRASPRLDLHAASDVATWDTWEACTETLSHLGDVPHVSHPLGVHCSPYTLLVSVWENQKAVFSWVREMAQHSRVLAVLPEDLDPVPRVQIHLCNSSSKGICSL